MRGGGGDQGNHRAYLFVLTKNRGPRDGSERFEFDLEALKPAHTEGLEVDVDAGNDDYVDDFPSWFINTDHAVTIPIEAGVRDHRDVGEPTVGHRMECGHPGFFDHIAA